MTIGERIKSLRLEKKLKQSELSQKAGISRVSIGNYERGDRVPNMEVLQNIAKALEVPVTHLSEEDSVIKIFASVKNILDNIDIDDLECIKPLGRKQVVEYFKCILLSTGTSGISDVINMNNDAIYILLNSEEFKTCMDLLYCKYKDAFFKK